MEAGGLPCVMQQSHYLINIASVVAASGSGPRRPNCGGEQMEIGATMADRVCEVRRFLFVVSDVQTSGVFPPVVEVLSRLDGVLLGDAGRKIHWCDS